MMLVYIAGPFSGKTRADVDANIARIGQLGVEVAKLGALPIMPHQNTQLPEFEGVQPYHFWIDGYLQLMGLCSCVLMAPDWESSNGARLEHAEAVDMTSVFYDLESLREWLDVVDPKRRVAK